MISSLASNLLVRQRGSACCAQQQGWKYLPQLGLADLRAVRVIVCMVLGDYRSGCIPASLFQDEAWL